MQYAIIKLGRTKISAVKLKLQVILGAMFVMLFSGWVLASSTAYAAETGSSRLSDIIKNGLVPCGRKDSPPNADATNVRPDDTCTLEDIFKAFARVTNFMLGFAGAFVVYKLISGAFGLVTSHGNEQAISEAKKKLMNAFWGFLLVLVSYLLISLVVYSLLRIKGPTDILTNPTNYIKTEIPSGGTGN